MSIFEENPLFIVGAIVALVLVIAELLSLVWVLIFGLGRQSSGHFAYTARFLLLGWIAACSMFGVAAAFMPQVFDAVGITPDALAFYLTCAVVAGAVIGAAIDVHILRRGDLRDPPPPFA